MNQPVDRRYLSVGHEQSSPQCPIDPPRLTTGLFLGRPPRIKRPPNVYSAGRECFGSDVKQMMFLGRFDGYEIILLFHVVVFIFEASHLLRFNIRFKDILQRRETPEHRARQTLLRRHLNYRTKLLLMRCHSCRCVWTRNEASSHITSEMKRHMHAVCAHRH